MEELKASGDHAKTLAEQAGRTLKVKVLKEMGINGTVHKPGAVLEVSAQWYENHPDGLELAGFEGEVKRAVGLLREYNRLINELPKDVRDAAIKLLDGGGKDDPAPAKKDPPAKKDEKAKA